MGTILVREVLRRVSYLLGDLSPVQFQRYRETELVDFLNDGALAIVTVLPTAGSRIDTIRLQPGSLQSIETIAPADCKPADGSTPTEAVRSINFLHAIRSRGTTGVVNGRALRVVDRKKLDVVDPDWQSDDRASNEVTGYAFDPLLPRHFWTIPPVKSLAWIEIAHNAEPMRIPNVGSGMYLARGSNATSIPLQNTFVDDLVNYVVARANMNQSEWADADKAAAFSGLFVASLNAKVAAQTGVNPNIRRLPFAPEPIGRAA